MPSVKLALDHVNEHSGVLRNYRLHMWWNDTMVSNLKIKNLTYFKNFPNKKKQTKEKSKQTKYPKIQREKLL